MKVLKFGSAALTDFSQLQKISSIIQQAVVQQPVIVVVAAFQGVHQQLVDCLALAAKGQITYQQNYEAIIRHHQQMLVAIQETDLLQQLAQELRDVLHGAYLLRDSTPRTLDLVTSFGERLAALVLTQQLKSQLAAYYVDARQFMITNDHFNGAEILYELTQQAMQTYFDGFYAQHGNSAVPVISGYIGATTSGQTTSMGKNGADYSAALIAATLKAEAIEIWTNVDGVYSADPRAVPAAFVLPQLSYEEALELSYFGAKVLHPAALAPALAKQIPIYIKNSFNPAALGTIILKKPIPWEGVVKGITAVDNIALLTLRGMNMLGVPGTAERLCKALASKSVNIILISQASSEHTICCAINESDMAIARLGIQQEFKHEFNQGFASLDEKDQQTIVTIVGDGMKGAPGVAGKIFQALGRHQININAIAQGASERNISLVIDAVQRVRALNVIHQAFFEKLKHLSLVLIGVGNIGSTLIKQLQQQQSFLRERGFNVKVCGVANSRNFVFDPDGLDLTNWQQQLADNAETFHPAVLTAKVATTAFTNAALVDCTASSELTEFYPEFVKANMHIITPNKKANVLPWQEYQYLLTLLKERQKYFLYEANVGAGLPIISTLQDLIAGGDTIIKIEGIFSGTLSYLFNHFDENASFSSLVKQAHAHGYTEPDPREDLSGMDVARKLLILARQLNWQLELSDLTVENLVPETLISNAFTEDFYQVYAAQYDAVLQARAREAKARGAVLRYVGVLHEGHAYAGLQEIPSTHPLASTKGSDNIIAFTTARYNQTPLVVQGPGAGAEVTAMGVFSDILKLLNYLPH